MVPEWSTYILSLVVLHDTAHGTSGGTQRRVEAVNVGLLDIGLFLATIPNLKSAGLVVGAVGAGNQLFVFTPVERFALVTVSLNEI